MPIKDQIGRYQIRKELGRGGMSTVYLAFDPNVDRQVALKLLPREFLHHPTFRERFDREARIIASLEHPAIVPIYDFGEDDGQPYFVMRFMRGGSLSDRIRNSPMALDQVVHILERIGSALDHAHAKGIIHRDLKPANILFDQYNKAYLGDFGIARLQETGASLTGTVYLGTPAYMSPEQISSDKELTYRADIYALGVILYEVLTGEKPYTAQTAAGLALKHVTEPVPRILVRKPDLPPDFDHIISKAMAKDPDDRYPSAVDLTAEVSRLAVGGTITAAARAKPIATDATMVAGADMTAAEPVTSDTVSGELETVLDVGAAAAVGAAAGAAIGVDTGTGASAGTGSLDAAGMTGAAAGAVEAPPFEKKPRNYVPYAAGGMIILAIICLAAALFLILGSGDGLGGLFGSDTETPTLIPTAAMTSSPVPSETATNTPTNTATVTEEPTERPTVGPTSSPTESIAPPTLRPTNTPLPSDTPRPTRPRATATSPPPPTSPPQPTSPPAPQPTSPPRPQPTSPPPPEPTPIPP